MHLFSVSYDLIAPGKDYKRLYDRLATLGARKALLSQWMLKSTMSAVQLRDDLQQHIDKNDRLLVIDVTSGAMAWTTLLSEIKSAFSLT